MPPLSPIAGGPVCPGRSWLSWSGELGPRWQARREARLTDRPRRRAIGAGTRHRLVFLDRLLATLVHLRHGVTHDVLACWFGVSRSTITRAIGEVRPLLAERGCTVEDGVQLRTLAEDHSAARAGAAGQDPLADRTRLPRVQDRTGPGPLRGPHLARLAPARHPGQRRPAVHHPATHQPKSACLGLTLYAVLRELQTLLATWTGTCAVCGSHIDSHPRAPT